MRFARFFMLLAAAGAVYAQTGATWDTSGNSMLKGTYYFRQVYYIPSTTYEGYLGEAVTIYGTMSFDGNGNYTIAASNGVQLIDYSFDAEQVENYANCTATYPCYTTTGTYAISGSGYGVISSPYATGDSVYGLVSSNGVFVGSSTDNSFGYNDMMLAAPLASPAPTNSSFTGTWAAAAFDLSSGSPTTALSLQFTLTPDGNGNLNAGTISGYSGESAALYQQVSSGVKYSFSSGAAVATFPANAELISGQKYLYFSKDGNFMFGGGPITSTTSPFDFIVAVKVTGSPTLSGLYYQAGLDSEFYDNEVNLDSYFGSFDMLAGAAPQTYLGHQRYNDYGGSSVYDYTYSNTISLTGNVYTGADARFIVGAGGAELITTGIYPYLGLSVALQAPCPVGTSPTSVQGQCTTTASGPYLNPTGVVNSASYAPFTAGIAPGELLTMFGSNLADTTQAVVGGSTVSSSLGGVQVSIGGLPAPVFSVAPGQVSAIVPYGVTVGSVVDIQLTNDMGTSNVVTNYVATTAPGVFTQCACGIGYGFIDHLGIGNSVAAVGSPVTDSNPAVEGETLAVGLTGLGAVSPSIADGALGPSGTLSQTTNTIAVDITGTTATTSFSGLLPGLGGEYQLNMTVPTGVTAGPNYLDISGPDSYMSYLLIPVQATAGSTAASATEPAIAVRPRLHRPVKGMPSLRNPQVKKPFSQARITDSR
jgi:uncharacterized protein (TIGR03437 family)